jgi:very-short-patch-repair endonuclease
LSYARYTTNHTAECYKQNFLRTPKGEKTLRPILEDFNRNGVPIKTSDVPGRGDALFFNEEILQVDGIQHYVNQKTIDHDAYMEQQTRLRQQRFRVWRFWEPEILCEPAGVTQMLAALVRIKRNPEVLEVLKKWR